MHRAPRPNHPGTHRLLLAALLAAGCAARKEPATPPSLEGLLLARTQAAWNEGGGSAAVGFRVGVRDAAGDAGSLLVSFVAPGGQLLGGASLSFDLGGRRDGTVEGVVDVPTARVGSFTLRFEARDARGATSARAAALFRVSEPQPVLATLEPSAAPRRSTCIEPGEITLTVTGSGFAPGATIVYAGYALATTQVDGRTLHAPLSARELCAPGSIAVRVVNPEALGGAASAPLIFTVAPASGEAPRPALTALSPATAPAESAPLTLSVTGSGFRSYSQVFWGTAPLTTSYLGPELLAAQVPAALLCCAGTVEVSVDTGSPGWGSAAGLPFVVTPAPARPVPVLTSLSPDFGVAGAGDVVVTLRGSGFVPTSRVLLQGGDTLPTPTFVDATTLRVALPASPIYAPYLTPVSVRNAPPGGGISAALPFETRLPAPPGMRVVTLPSRDLAWNPYERLLYLTVPRGSVLQPGTVSTLDPATGERGPFVAVGGDPNLLSASEDGRYLYVSVSPGSVVRLALPSLAPDLAIALPATAAGLPLEVSGLAASPADGRTVAVAMAGGGVSRTVVYDDGAARAGEGTGDASVLWAPDGSALYGTGKHYAVTAQGLGAPVAGGLPAGATQAAIDPVTGWVYQGDGQAIDPATWQPAGVCAGVPVTASVLPDASLGHVYFAGQGEGYLGVYGYDLTRYRLADFAPDGSAFLPGFYGSFYTADRRSRLLRWSADGLAVRGGRDSGGYADVWNPWYRGVALFEGEAVLPVPAVPNPAPSIAALSPATAAAGSGNLRITVTGSGFVPGTAVRWNGAIRFAERRGDAELRVHVPASDLAAAGTASVAVVNPAPGGGASAPLAFTVTP